MITYTSSKLDIVMCDHLGRFVSEILYENERLRNWFVDVMWDFERPYPTMIIDEKDYREAEGSARVESDFKAQDIADRERKEMLKELEKRYGKNIPRAEIEKMNKKIMEILRKEAGKLYSDLLKKYITEAAIKKMTEPKYEKRKWRVDSAGKLTDAYKIMAHYMFFTKDPIWLAMDEVYKDVIDKYNLDYSDNKWLDNSLKKAEEQNDRMFKQFYYGTVAAKFLEGHVQKALEFINTRLMKELEKYPDADELKKIAKNLKITIEIPDARDPKYAGLYLLWHPKQIYAAIKTIRKRLKTDKLFITMDWEHMAGHGVDPLVEVKKLEKIAPDFGKYVLSVHSNSPNPLHAHYPIEIGDIEIYTLLYFLRKTGLGKQDFDVYIYFERGGGEDPFRQSIDALKLMVKYLEKDIPPDELPEAFFGISMTAMDFERQRQIILDHRFDVIKDLLEIPEEEWTFLSSVATKKGKAKEFKKEEMR